MIRRLTKLVNDLNSMGLRKEADYLGAIIRLAADEKGITLDFGDEGDEQQIQQDYETWNQGRKEFLEHGKIPLDEPGEIPTETLLSYSPPTDPTVARLEARISMLEKEVKRLKGESYSEWYEEQDAMTQQEHDRASHQQDVMDISREFHEHEMDVD